MSMKEKTALVTGAGGGIGRASARAFAREGANVVVADIDEEGGLETVRLIGTDHGSATFIRADVSSVDDVDGLVDEAVSRFGGLHYAHNNAGVAQAQMPLADIDRGTWDRMLSVNLTGAFNCLQAELRYMAAHGGGAIVATSSATSLLGFPMTAAYAVTKAGINQLVRSAASEYGKHGVRANAILPGPIDTEMMAGALADPSVRAYVEGSLPLGRLGTPEDIAEAVVWLCSDRSSFITGVTLLADGGQLLM